MCRSPLEQIFGSFATRHSLERSTASPGAIMVLSESIWKCTGKRLLWSTFAGVKFLCDVHQLVFVFGGENENVVMLLSLTGG